MSAVGFVSQLGADARRTSAEASEQKRDDALALRERQADQIQASITNFQKDPNLSEEERKFKISEAQQQLTGLYQPHEGQDLFNRLGRLIHHGHTDLPPKPNAIQTRTPAMATGGVNIPPGPTTQVELKPGMTIADILGASSNTPKPEAAAATNDVQQKMDQVEAAYEKTFHKSMSDDEKERFFRHLAGGAPLEPKPAAAPKPPKGLKYDSATDEVVDSDTGKRYTRKSKNMPEDVAAMFGDAESVQKKKNQLNDTRFAQRLEMQTRAIAARFDAGDYVAARRNLNKAKDDYRQSVTRATTMDQNLIDARKGSQQAMLSMVANHIGMTLGAQKGARITRAVWDEATESAPWISSTIAKSFHQDENGDYIFDGWKGGVTLTDDQMQQMVDLAHQKVDIQKQAIQGVEEDYSDDLAKGGKHENPAPKKNAKPTTPAPAPKTPSPTAAAPATTSDPLADAIVEALSKVK